MAVFLLSGFLEPFITRPNAAIPGMLQKEAGSGSTASSEVPLCAGKVTASLLMLINFSASNYPLYSWLSGAVQGFCIRKHKNIKLKDFITWLLDSSPVSGLRIPAFSQVHLE
ncbi:hypothetical protein E5288_WYG002814 [Bos mutus]|uniref:Uncharacterized protein n=1 Tax=Bos mutus TaxID=72004 RepID=A0A6B0S7Z1_9CETA|nr:hypothetical protein [Bos mutus]